ncbi:MAG TPA: BMC domain-containing protein [Acidobacteriota bacterium]|nr:BMC domain-containing protein [Acidobacteriota bacterium]
MAHTIRFKLCFENRLPFFDAMSRPALGLIETRGLAGALAATRAATDAGQVVIASLEQTDAGIVTVRFEGDWQAVQQAVEAGARAAEALHDLISMHVIPRTDNGLSPILPYGRFVARYRSEEDRGPSPPRTPSLKPASRPEHREIKLPPAQPAPAVPTVARVAPPPKPPVTPEPAVIPAPAVQPTSAPQPLSLDELAEMPVVKLRKYARTIRNLPIQGRQISKANKETLLEAIRSVRVPE